MTLFVLFCPASGYLKTSTHCKNKGKRKMTNRPCFTLPQVYERTFEVGNQPFDSAAFVWKTLIPPGGLRLLPAAEVI